MRVLLSIKPEFSTRIFEGVKKFEYRRAIFKKPVDGVVVYASAPISMVVGEFEISDLLFHDLNTLWRKTRKHSGITEEYFFSYFSNKTDGYAIQIGRTRKYRSPLMLREVYGLNPPQSYVYV